MNMDCVNIKIQMIARWSWGLNNDMLIQFIRIYLKIIYISPVQIYSMK